MQPQTDFTRLKLLNTRRSDLALDRTMVNVAKRFLFGRLSPCHAGLYETQMLYLSKDKKQKTRKATMTYWIDSIAVFSSCYSALFVCHPLPRPSSIKLRKCKPKGVPFQLKKSSEGSGNSLMKSQTCNSRPDQFKWYCSTQWKWGLRWPGCIDWVAMNCGSYRCQVWFWTKNWSGPPTQT